MTQDKPDPNEARHIPDQIEQAKQQWEATVDSLPQLICLLDSQGRILRANRTAESWDLSPVHKVKGQVLHQLFHSRCDDPGCYFETHWPRMWNLITNHQTAEFEIEDRRLQRHFRFDIRPIATATRRRDKLDDVFAAVIIEDITEQKLVSLALGDAQIQVSTLFENSPLGIALSSEGKFVAANRAILEMLRLAEEEDLLQRSVLDFYCNPGDREILLKRLQKSRFVQDFGVELVRDDGSPFFASLSMSKLVLGGDEVLLAMVEDVSEQVNAETALRESEQRFKTLFQSMPLPSYFWQRRKDDIVLVDYNVAADEFTHGGASRLVGLSLTEMYPDRPDIVEDITRCAAKKITIRKEMKYTPRTFDEDVVLAVTYSFAPPDLVIVQTEDISERKQAQEALQASEEKYRDLVEKISDVIYTVDVDGLITYLNPAVESLTGRPVEQLVGQSFAQFFHSDDLRRLQDNFQTLLSGEVPGPEEYRLLNALGENRWIRVTSQPVVDGGRVTGLQGVLTDITERKKAEEQLKQSATQAERDRLARDLHDAVTQTLFSASLLADTMPRIWEKDQTMARQNLTQLGLLLRGALAEMRTLLVELRPGAVKNQSMGKLFGPLADVARARTRAAVSINVENDRVLTEEVSLTLLRIAQEALNNVAKHAEATEVDIKLDCDPERVVLRITDDGRGFDPTDIPPGHFGIGIMADRARAIGADLEIESNPGSGTQVMATWLNPPKRSTND